jgi:hypothetical protein
MFRRMSIRLLIVGGLLGIYAAGSAASAQASGYRLSLAATFHVPVPADATQNGWCYDLAAVSARTHRFYLADAANRQITVIDPTTGAIAALGPGYSRASPIATASTSTARAQTASPSVETTSLPATATPTCWASR